MDTPVEWKPWSTGQIVSNLPRLINMVGASLEDFPEEYREKNQVVVKSLREKPPTIAEMREGVHDQALMTLGYALDLLGNICQRNKQRIELVLACYQGAHELFRGGNTTLHPTKPMRQILNSAWRALLLHETTQLKAGTVDAGAVLEEIKTFVVSAWGYVSSQMTLSINEMMLYNLESIRASVQDDTDFYEKFVRDNIETMLAMEVPTRLEKVQDQWEEIGRHVAPAATSIAVRTLKRPQDLSALLPKEVWNQLQQALGQADVNTLFQTLSRVEDDLETNLRLRLTAKPDYREPNLEIRYRGGPDRFFTEAHDLLLRKSPAALQKFQNIHFRKSNEPIAKEWYAYALSRFGRETDIFDIIQLLEDAIALPSYNSELGWTARWNLACTLRKLSPRAHEALDVLLPVLENDDHSAEVFELCLLWTLEQEREEVLSTLLLKSPFYEAHLLSMLDYLEAHQEEKNSPALQDHFRRLNRILRDPDHVFPDPMERLEINELDRLTRDFIETSLVPAGIEWFRQRVSYGSERFNWKNWECAIRLNERAGDMQAAWRCYRRQWQQTRNKPLSPERKMPILRGLLSWAERNNFQEDALRVLRQDWQKTSMTDADVRMYEVRWGKAPSGYNTGEGNKVGPSGSSVVPTPPLVNGGSASPKADLLLPVEINPVDAEQIIQREARKFTDVNNADMLADKAEDALRLIVAVAVKHHEVRSGVMDPMRAVIELAVSFHKGVSDQQAQELSKQMRDQLAPLQKQIQSLPYEITGLAEACQRVIQNMVTRVKGFPEIIISTFDSLKQAFDRPAPGESYPTRIVVRLTNPSAEEMRDINVAFTSPSSHIYFLEQSLMMVGIGPEGKVVVDVPVEVSSGVEEKVEVRVHVSYKIAGIVRSGTRAGYIPVRPVGPLIPFRERYMTDAPVTADRTDLFHGRDKELNDLQSTFAGGKLLRLYFVNGIRRVGKSTLMYQLMGCFDNETLPLLLNLQSALGESNMTTVQLVRQLIRLVIDQVRLRKDLSALSLAVPGPDVFELDPPWVVFQEFLETLQRQAGKSSVLLCFDEVQYLVERIANPNEPINDAFLAWMRGKVQEKSHILLICTGSEPYALMRRRYEHTLWGNMQAYNVSFVERAAMEKIATLPVKEDGVTWLQEAIDRLWDMTEGHPWLTQTLAEKVAEGLNNERRRVVGPGDVSRAVDVAMLDDRYSDLWWNEKEGQVTATNRQIAFIILRNQSGSRQGLPESKLAEECQRSGIRVSMYLDEMRALEVLTEIKEGNDPRWRIKGGFLEKYLMTLLHHEALENGLKRPSSSDQSLALMLDWENIKISLLNSLKKMPAAEAQSLRPRLAGAELAKRLLEAAAQHGVPRQKWVVANWDHATFNGDQAALRRERYMTDMSGETKADASDHVLRERIHNVLRDQREIGTYIIGTGDADFGEVIGTLQDQGKHVILWATKGALSGAFKHFLSGPDAIQIEWLEDIIFKQEAATR